MNTQKTTIFG